jgi:hypothetical protein
VFEVPGKDIHISFKKANFNYSLVEGDDIKIEGDIQVE